jgi:hypothetical protein
VPAAPGAPGTSAGAPAAAPDAVPPPGASTPAPILTPTPTQAPEAAVSATPAETSRPFYRRGWFYGVVGAVLVAAAVSAWAISSSGGTEIPETPLGNQRVFEK